MARVHRRIVTKCMALLFALAAPFPSVATRADDHGRAWKILTEPIRALHREKPATGSDDCIEHLAREIDWLEHHIDKYGSIVAKHPDVWGESRMMRHRAEYEETMAAQLGAFEVRMNAALRRSDQAFLGMAFALQGASGRDATGAMIQPPSVSQAQTNLSLLNAIVPDPNAPVTTGQTAVITRTAPFAEADPAVPGFTFENEGALSLEPTVQLNQMSRYLNHLHELRRINEGDDIADSPGYSLNLVRIPVSVLPGKHTRKGYGAELTVIAEPYLGEDLLPITFRDLVINDLVDLLAPALTHIVNQPEVVAASQLKSNAAAEKDTVQSSITFKAMTPAISARVKALDLQIEKAEAQVQQKIQTSINNEITVFIPANKTRRSRLPLPASQIVTVFGSEALTQLALDIHSRLGHHPVNKSAIHYMDVRNYLTSELQGAYEFLSEPERFDLWQFCGHQLASAIRQLQQELVYTQRCGFLNATAEIKVEVPEAGSSRNDPCCNPFKSSGPVCKTVTAALAWSIIVESALLNERLIQDMREAGTSAGCLACAEAVGPFYGPAPSIEARMAFNEYVKCRWPIRVFALDPVADQQNVADEYARRRELQVAMALAFASGQMNAQAMMRYARRLEWDMATIALNQTVVGFSHGSDTFGWRFHPRFQTPPVKGTLATFGETLFGGPTTDADLRERQLEPGIRECTAIVVMPSFVPYCTFDVRTNWFSLTHPKDTEITMKDTMVLSRSIKAMQQSAGECGRCAHLYRDGEVHRLLRRVDQLERELPLQTMQTQIPYENTAGGFELFNVGITDLEPELVGWYGAPGISPYRPTTMYLIGDGFSVHDTRLIAGGQNINFRLLSRQVMEVEIPHGVQIMRAEPNSEINFEEVVDVHVATPYGVSSHLLVPVSKPSANMPGAPGTLAWQPGGHIVMGYRFSGDPPNRTVAIVPGYFGVNPDSFAISVPSSAALPATQVKAHFYLHHGQQPLGAITPNEVLVMDIDRHQYRITGDRMTTLVFGAAPNSLNSKLGHYLEWLHKNGQLTVDQNSLLITVTTELEVNGHTLPVLGTITVELKKLD